MVSVTRKGLRKWAASKPEGAEVGTAGSTCFCPIATYLGEKGVRNPVVTYKAGLIGVKGQYYNGHGYTDSKLAGAIAWEVDLVTKRGGVVTREAFLAILDELEG